METLQRMYNRGSVVTGPYDIENSAAFGGGHGLQNTLANDGDSKKKWTISMWVKRSEIGVQTGLFGAANTIVNFMSDDILRISLYTGSATYYYDTARVFRDTSAWYHIVFQCDTTDGTAANRTKLWINGELNTAHRTQYDTSANISQNMEFTVGLDASNMQIGYFYSGQYQLDGYMADIYFTDNVANDADAFGEYDEDSGIWKPKAYAGAYGDNGFHLEFKEAAASATGIGKDTSGNGHNFDTGGAHPSQATDTPTNNFCTLMPPQVSIRGTKTNVTEGGTQMTGGDTTVQNAFGSMGVSKGKWYFESNVSNLGGVDSYNFYFGIIAADKITTLTDNSIDQNFIGSRVNTWGFTSNNRGITNNVAAAGFPFETATSGTTEVMGIALDMDNGKIWVHKAGTYATNDSSVTGNPATGAAPQYANLLTSTSEHILVGGGVYTLSTAAQRNMNFGNPMSTNFTGVGTHSDGNGYGSFAYAPPTGYYALCTKNLAEYGG